MLIGCLFTMAGYTLSTLTNTPTQAQDEKVIDKIVCKELEIVNMQSASNGRTDVAIHTRARIRELTSAVNSLIKYD